MQLRGFDKQPTGQISSKITIADYGGFAMLIRSFAVVGGRKTALDFRL
ncbi:MAG TPA: hypothetical protein VN784_14320 [Candidatus Limnocylindrales bacterium]|nr:hypothetical protein [Candidatus Limnocylindrales bacterium]